VFGNELAANARIVCYFFESEIGDEKYFFWLLLILSHFPGPASLLLEGPDEKLVGRWMEG
jgi:hypothetical protein